MMNIAEQVKSESNAAKILGAYIVATGATSERCLSDVLDIPLSEIQRLKREALLEKGCFFSGEQCPEEEPACSCRKPSKGIFGRLGE